MKTEKKGKGREEGDGGKKVHKDKNVTQIILQNSKKNKIKTTILLLPTQTQIRSKRNLFKIKLKEL